LRDLHKKALFSASVTWYAARASYDARTEKTDAVG
jgi:hypothetical protein